MMFPWVEYLEVAENLCASEKESFCRAAVSRAYYAAFGEAKRFVGITGDWMASVHKDVIDSLAGHAEKDAKVAGGELNNLRRMRVDADYKGDVRVSKLDAESAIAEARGIIETLSRLSS